MFTAALYQWSVATCPVNIFLEIPLADRLRAVATASDVEIGGFLVGYFENNRTVVTDFELVDSEHRRGTAYALSRRDDQQLVSKLNASRKRQREVVGFFRSHLRPGMFLDAADDSTLQGHFNNPQQVALLVKPGEDGSATGGFFFWQDGEMDRKETSRTFPMHSEELASDQPHPAALAFDAAATMDELPKMQSPVPAPAPVSPKAAGKSNAFPNWAKIGLVAAAAALGGYYLGTSNNQEHFGSRPGDITINAVTEPQPAPAPPKQVAQVNAAPITETPAAPTALLPIVPATKPKPVKETHTAPPSAPVLAPQPVNPPPAPQPVPEPVPIKEASAFPHNPNPLPAPTPVVPAADTTVDLEAAQDGGIKHALHKIHLFGASRDSQDFHPAVVLRRTTPRVPADVARGLTADVPLDLKLKVDNTGRVSSVEVLTKGISRALLQLAGDAAYDWQFQPAQLKDRPVSSEVIAHFLFKPAL